MDLEGLKKNLGHGFTFGLFTVAIPFVFGFVAGIWLLSFSVPASFLMGCILASHTLVAYPIIGRYGLMNRQSVVISVTATMVALVFALMVLAIISGTLRGMDNVFEWMWLGLRFVLLIAMIFLIFPRIIRWFFRHQTDNIIQYIFVLAMVFLAAAVAEFCGIEGILGAFFCGLVFNRFIPASSTLMNRTEFVGNAIFIPYFLIGVGMLVNVKPMFTSGAALTVVIVMVVAGTLSKYLAAIACKRLFNYSSADGLMMFGLSEAHAAGALAMVMVGTELHYPDGTPLMNSDVLDGVVVMILISCIISSIATDQASKQLKLADESQASEEGHKSDDEKILVPIHEPSGIPGLVNTAIMMRNQKLNRGIICLNVVNDDAETQEWLRHSKECLEQAERLCAAADVSVQTQSRLAVNFVNGVIHAFRENDASEIIIGLHRKRTPSDSLLGRFAQGLIDGLRRQVTIVHYNIPVSMVRRIVVAIPESAEYESGFHRWVERLARLSLEIGCAIHFYGEEQTCERIRLYLDHHHKGIRADYFDFDMGDGLDQLASEVNDDHLLVVVSARQGTLSYRNHVNKLQPSLKAHFSRCNLMIIFPDQSGENEEQSTFSQPLVQEKYEPPAITKWLSKYISKIG